MADAAARTARIEELEANVRDFGARDPAGSAIRALFETIWKVNQQGLHENLPSDLDFLQSNIEHFRRSDANKSCPLRSAVYSMVEATKCMLATLKEKQSANDREKKSAVSEPLVVTIKSPTPAITSGKKPAPTTVMTKPKEESVEPRIQEPRFPGPPKSLHSAIPEPLPRPHMDSDIEVLDLPKEEPLDPYQDHQDFAGPSFDTSEELEYSNDDTADSLPQFDTVRATSTAQIVPQTTPSPTVKRPRVQPLCKSATVRLKSPAAPAAIAAGTGAAAAAGPSNKLMATSDGVIIAVPPETAAECREAASVGDLIRKGMKVGRKRKEPVKTATREVGSFKCTHCKKIFVTADYLDKHMIEHAGPLPVKCPKCLRTFKTKANLDVHLKHQHKAQNPIQLPWMNA